MKKEIKMMLCMVLIVMLFLTGCQTTPEKSSVASKADGLSEEFIAEPLGQGRLQKIDMPEHWSASEKKSNDRVTILADLEMGKLETGNRPVVEMKNHSMTQEELEKLVTYFAEGEELYVPQADTKAVFQSVKDRIEQKEGVYANPVLGSFLEMKTALDEAIRLAPENPAEEEKAELKFQRKTADAAGEAANSWAYKLGVETPQIPDAEVFFAADVGKSREAHMEAECYDPEIANCSRFTWKTGTDRYDLEEIRRFVRMNEFITDTSGYQESFRKLLEQYEDALEQETFSAEEGQKQAEQVMKDLDMPEMELLSADRTLWFPEEKMPDARYGQTGDFFWQADPREARAAYRYVFTRAYGGISAERAAGISGEEAADSYISPFPVETVSITVADGKVKAFSWTGMCEEADVIAEHVKLLPFEEIQERLFDQIYYYYLGKGQPEEDATNFRFRVTAARLGYTYVTAFGRPENAWLVPAWSFQVMEGSGLGEDIRDFADFQVTINGMDGGAIAE